MLKSDVFETYKPDGFHTVNSYMFVEDPEALIGFLQKAFLARELNRTIHPETGIIRNAILQIGDSCFMLSQSTQGLPPMPTAFYLFVSDTDSVYKNALNAGAEPVFEPADMPYGDRQGGVKDPAGNYWWVSTRLVQQNYQD